MNSSKNSRNNFFFNSEENDIRSILFNDSANNGNEDISQNDLPLSSINYDDIQFEEMNIGQIKKSNDISLNSLDMLNNFIIAKSNGDPSNNQIIKINEINNSKNYNLSIENMNKNNIGIKIIRFQTKIKKNTGSIEDKKNSKENKQKSFIKKRHLAKDDDNILRKIQVHYLSFITSFTNDVIKAHFPNQKLPLFKIIDYEIKKIVNHKFVEEIKNKTIGEILQLRVSPKFKNSGEKANKEIYDMIVKKYPEIQDIFGINYISFFKEYYFKENKIFFVSKKIIPISNNTKTFVDLCSKNYCFKEDILKVVLKYYFNCHKRFKKPKFISKKCQD